MSIKPWWEIEAFGLLEIGLSSYYFVKPMVGRCTLTLQIILPMRIPYAKDVKSQNIYDQKEPHL